MVRLYINVSQQHIWWGLKMSALSEEEENINPYLGIYPIDDSIFVGHYKAVV